MGSKQGEGRVRASAPVPIVDLGVGTYLSDEPSQRYPVYTRGNAGEVWPEGVYPLSFALARRRALRWH